MATYITGLRYFIVLLMLAAAGCTPATKLDMTWKDPAAKPLAFKKVAVVVLNSTPAERRGQEDELVSHITRASAVPSYTFVSDSEISRADVIKQKIVAGGFDGAVVLRIVDSTKEQTYVPGSTSFWTESDGYPPYHYHSSGYYVTDTIIRAEISVYSVPDGKLLWVGASSTTNPENARKMATQIAKVATDELKKEGLIP